MSKVYQVEPVPKPRMTRRDKWTQRKCVQEYWRYKDLIRAKKIELPEAGAWVIFVLPMPASWSKKKKEAYNLTPHKQRPDKDNLEKGLLDALFDEDSHIWDLRASKVWGYSGSIIIKKQAIDIQEFNHEY